jgi:hypothetical protein
MTFLLVSPHSEMAHNSVPYCCPIIISKQQQKMAKPIKCNFNELNVVAV